MRFCKLNYAGTFCHLFGSKCVCVRVCVCTDFVSFVGYDDIETSPYEDIELDLVRNSEVTKLASIVAGTSLLQHSSSATYTNNISALCYNY